MDDHETKPPLINLHRPFPTATSTIPELISFLRSSHHQNNENFDLVIKILSAREQNLNNSAKEMSINLELIESKNCKLVVEKVAIEEELKKCRKEMDGFRFECGELREKLMRSFEELKMHVEREKRADERYKKLFLDCDEALREEKLRSEAETVAWKNKYHDLVHKVFKPGEEDITGLVENGPDSSSKNHDNGRTNKQLVLDSRSPSHMMDSPILGNGKTDIIELGDSDDDKPIGNGIPLTTTSASEPDAKETCENLGSSQMGEKDNRNCKETSTPHSLPNAKRASRSEMLETNIGQHKMRRLQVMGHGPKVSSCSFDTSNLGDKSLMDSFMEDLLDNPQGERECEDIAKLVVNEEELLVPVKRKRDDVASKIGRKKKSLEVVGNDVEKRPFEHCCKPGRLIELDLTPAQRKDVKAIGFGGLLDVKVKRLPVGFVQYLVERFDHNNCIQRINDDKYYVTTNDVFDILCLPRNVKKVKINCSLTTDMNLRERYIKTFGKSKDGIHACRLFDRIKELRDGGDEFKRLYVLYVVGYFLAPVVTRGIDASLLGLVEDVSQIRNFDWCRFVFDRLCDGVKRYKKMGIKGKSCSGCVMILLIAYLHRYPYQGKHESTQLPLIQHWTHDKMKERAANEGKSGWGNLIYLENVYPISKYGDDLVDVPEGQLEACNMGLLIEAAPLVDRVNASTM